MIFQYITFVFLSLVLPFTLHAQERLACTTHSLSDSVLAANPDQQLRVLEMEEALQSQSNQIGERDLTSEKIIPVVIHIIEDYSTGKVTNEQVLNAMDELNASFQGTQGDIGNVFPDFTNIVGAMNVKFRLAQLDPDGNCTSGITRTASPMTRIGGENVKTLIKWDPRKYVNVWVVDNIPGAGGYTFLPGSAPSAGADAGILVRASQFGSGGVANSGLSSLRTLPHEFGHYFGLRHTWGGTNTPEVQSNCDVDDNVQDTPNTEGHSSGCGDDYMTCGSVDNIQNIMDYSSCPIMFTVGQMERMDNFLHNYDGLFDSRSNLWTASNLQETGTSNGYVAQTCTPKPNFFIQFPIICAGNDITITSEVYDILPDQNAVYNWSLTNGTETYTATGEEPNIVIEEPGRYDITLTVTQNGVTGSITKEKYLLVPDPSGATIMTSQSFEGNWTLNDQANSASWMSTSEIEDGSGASWEVYDNAGFEGEKSLRALTRNNTGYGRQILITPVLNLNFYSNPLRMYYETAYKSNPSEFDRLRIYSTRNCGSSWFSRGEINREELVSAPGFAINSYLPSSVSQWDTRDFSLNNHGGNDDVIIAFIYDGIDGTPLYLDNVRIEGDGVGIEENTTVDFGTISPNPVGSERVVSIANDREFQTAQLIDALGNVRSVSIERQQGTSWFDLGTNTPKGVYYLRLVSEGEQASYPLIIID